jgi:hypothetical protein
MKCIPSTRRSADPPPMGGRGAGARCRDAVVDVAVSSVGRAVCCRVPASARSWFYGRASELGRAVGSFAAGRVAGRSSAVLVETPELIGIGTSLPTITFGDAPRWEFDVPRAGRSAAHRVLISLGG